MRYLIYRHGANAANQSLCDRMPVAIVDAESAEDAVACESDPKPSVWTSAWLAWAPSVKVWANQYCTAVPENEADGNDWDAVLEDAIERVEDINE